ncbi:MAG: hypothetical protein OD815_001370 [Candidatus Alkanophagales archaeon MCA70_species_2]|nr:hypothetical protein [Candidatus Alkanophaga liquidiphilum]
MLVSLRKLRAQEVLSAHVPKRFRHELALKNGAAKKSNLLSEQTLYVQKFYKAAALI